MRFRPLSLLVLVSLVSISACTSQATSSSSASSTSGLASRSPQQILTAVQDAVRNVRSVTLHGVVRANGQTTTLDFQIRNPTGVRSSQGTLATSGISFQLIRIGNALYVQGNQPSLQQLCRSAGKVPAGAWLRTTVNDPNFKPLIDSLDREFNFQVANVQKAGISTLNGQRVVALVARGRQATLYVAASGPAYPVEVTAGTGSNQGSLTFSAYNERVVIRPPASVPISQCRPINTA